MARVNKQLLERAELMKLYQATMAKAPGGTWTKMEIRAHLLGKHQTVTAPSTKKGTLMAQLKTANERLVAAANAAAAQIAAQHAALSDAAAAAAAAAEGKPRVSSRKRKAPARFDEDPPGV